MSDAMTDCYGTDEPVEFYENLLAVDEMSDVVADVDITEEGDEEDD